MNRRGYSLVGGAIFSFPAIAHLARLAAGREIPIAGEAVPLWAPFPVLVVPGCLATWHFSLAAAEGRSGRPNRFLDK